MVKMGLQIVVRHVRGLAAGRERDQCTDGDLLRQFARGRDADAFAAIVRRHGPMVMRVCRHVLRQEQDAEDAFQVTFLVLARRPSAIRKGGSLASWLHGVAYRTAMTARRTAAIRQRHEARAAIMSQRPVTQELAWREVQAILEEEVQALPEVYRAPFVLCHVEGRSRQEAARELGICEGTVSSRLDRGQKHLRQHLAARGVVLSAALGALATGDGLAAVPRRLLDATIRAGAARAAGGALAGTIPASAEVLLKAVTRGLGLTRTTVATAFLAAVVVAGVATLPERLLGRNPSEAAAPDSPSVSGARPTSPASPAKPAEETVTLSGQVLDPDGKPFGGAEVAVGWFWNTGDPSEPGIKTTSGPDGHFRFHFARSRVGKPQLPPHPEPYQFAPLRVAAAARCYGPGWVSVERGARGDGLTLRLVRDDVPIRGRILDLELRPVRNATVRALSADGVPLDPWPGMAQGVRTAPDGNFVLKGIGRDRTIRLSIEGPTIERKTVEVLTAKASTATIEVVARPTRIVEGTVCADDTGKPLPGVVVRGGAQHGVFTEIYTLTDARGHYRLVGLPKGGAYEVTAWPNRGLTFLPRAATVADTRGLQPLSVNFRLQRGVALRVRLIDKGTGKPVRGIVHYDPLASNPARQRLMENGVIAGHQPWQFSTAYPDQEGYVHFVALPGPGLVVGAGHDTPYLPRPIDPADAKAYPVLAKVPFLLGGLSDYAELFQSYRVFDAKPGDKPVDIDIDLDAGYKVEARLVGPDSRPVVGAVAFGLAHSPQKTANWSYRNDPAYRARVESHTLATDRFASAGLTPDGARTVTFVHTGRKLIANVVVRADHKGPLTVRLEPWAAVTGRVVDENGKPVHGVRLELLYPSQDGPGLLSPGTAGVAPGLLAPGWPFQTDANGRFRIEGLLPGQNHRLLFPGGVVKEVRAEAGRVRDLPDIRVSDRPAESKRGHGGGAP